MSQTVLLNVVASNREKLPDNGRTRTGMQDGKRVSQRNVVKFLFLFLFSPRWLLTL
ncbi:MAG: hypothetical protein A07HR60_01153 [uncultured archaeon A07HR60]|nr:MAG: hypothetical protein A07HR60_01153 [uncultured archaeon A07HR60]